MTYPPRWRNISIPAVIAGNVLQNDDTSISANDSGFDGSLIMRTENKLAMLITPDQHTAINTENHIAQFTVNNDILTQPIMRLSYQDSFYFDVTISADGTTAFVPSCDDVRINDRLITVHRKNIHISDHNGIDTGLILGGALVTASGTELNYVDVPIGVATAKKALVLDTNKNITGVNYLGATELTGTLLTGPQPNITEMNTVNIKTNLYLKGELFDISPTTIRYLQVLREGIAYPSKAMVLDADKNFIGINNLSANNLTGTLTSGPQPNITELATLQSLANNGPTKLYGMVSISTSQTKPLTLIGGVAGTSKLYTDDSGSLRLFSTSSRIKIDDLQILQIASHNGTTAGLMLGNSLVMASAAQLDYTKATPGVAAAVKALVLDSNKSVIGVNVLEASVITGTLRTNDQPNILSVNTLNIKNHRNEFGLQLSGVLVTATADQLNRVDITPGIVQPGKAFIVDDTLNIAGLNHVGANELTGTLLTPDQPNIKSVLTLRIINHYTNSGLVLGNTLVTSTGAQLNTVNVTIGEAAASKALILDTNKNIIGINTLSATYLAGTIQTAVQPNLTEVEVLNINGHDGYSKGLSLNDVLVTSTADDLNRVDVTAGVAAMGKALVVDNLLNIRRINNIVCNYLEGELVTSYQPNLTKVDSLHIGNHNGTTTGLMLRGTLVQCTAEQLNYNNVSSGVASPNRSLVLDYNGSITGINSLSAAYLNGIIQSESQPYITRVATLNIMNHNGATTGLSLNGTLVVSTGEQLNYLSVRKGVAEMNKALVLDEVKSIFNINVVSAISFSGLLTTPVQPNISTVNTLNISRHDGGAMGLALNGVLVTSTAAQLNFTNVAVGSAQAYRALVVDGTKNITGINSISSNVLLGSLQTEYQPGVTKVDVLNIANHNGSTGLRLNDNLVIASATQLNYTTAIPGTASSSKALIMNEFNSISGINALSATKISAGQLTLTGVIANFNVGSLVAKTYSFTDFVGRLIDIQLLTSLNFSGITLPGQSDGYSTEIVGYIKPKYSEIYSFYVTCADRVRLWINGELVIHSWAKASGSRISVATFLNAEQWVPIYIQYQVDTGSTASFILEWVCNSESRGQIPATRFAWDSNEPSVGYKLTSQNSFTIYNSATTTASTTKFEVDTSGDLTIDASGNDINLGASDNLNIVAHNGGTKGLYLGGVLVQPTAYEINYLKVNPGLVSSSHALVVDASKSIAGINALTAASIDCNVLSAGLFSISDLKVPGPLRNYNTGGLLVRQFIGPNYKGNLVDVSLKTDLEFIAYDKVGLNTNYSIDVIGYIYPSYSENYTFYAYTNDKVRIWVDGVLILNVWEIGAKVEYTSASITLTANQWVPIYIQYQCKDLSSVLQIRWAATTLIKSAIGASSMSWDNTVSRPYNSLNSADTFTVFSSADGLATPQTGKLSIDGNGVMNLSSKTGWVGVAQANNFNIAGHNGTVGLRLAGNLVVSSAAELNYLAGAAPGVATPLKAIVLNSANTLSGFASLSSDNLYGAIRTANQPYITSFGTLASTLSTSSDIIMTNTNSLRLTSDATACYIQAGSSTTADAAADLFIGNYNSTPTTSSRKLMIKSSGFIGIQTTSPTRALSINSAGATYCLRLIKNSATGAETAFCDIGVDTSSTLCIKSNVMVGSSATATISVDSLGNMKVAPSGPSVQIGNATNATLPLEVGSASYTLSTSVGYLNADGSIGLTTPVVTSYSLRTASSIIVNGTVCVTSDRRLKKKIEPLSYNDCRRFIMNSKPVKFEYIADKNKTNHCGLIAQDVAKTEFSNLVNASPHEGLQEEMDHDGYVSPAGAAFNVAYEEIVPILMMTMKETIQENALLKSHVCALSAQLKSLEEKMKLFERRFE